MGYEIYHDMSCIHNNLGTNYIYRTNNINQHYSSESLNQYFMFVVNEAEKLLVQCEYTKESS